MKYKLGAIGFGNMGGAILSGAVSSGLVKPSETAVFDLVPEKREECKARGYALCESASEVFESCEKVLFAVKPQGMDALLSSLREAKKPYPTIICIVAGFPSRKIRDILPGVHVIRVMPNTPLLLGCGATALCACEGATEDELCSVRKIFDTLGETCVLREEQMNDIIAVNGSSPAFVYYYIEAIARWAEGRGLCYEDALRLCAKTFEGSAKMILRGDVAPAELIRRVCSPGGTTLAAMDVLKAKNADGILQEAASACSARAEELGRL